MPFHHHNTIPPQPKPPSPFRTRTNKNPTGDEEKLLFLQILSEQNIKIDYAAVAAKVGRSASAVKQHLNKMKNEAKKATSNFASTADNTASGAADDDTPKASKRRATLKQKAALETAISKGDTAAAGSGSSDGNRTEEPTTPIKTAAAKKSRAPAKPKDGEPAAKKQKTAGTAEKATESKTDGKATTPTAFTEQLLTAASPVGTGSSIKMEEGSDGAADAEKKRKHGMMDGNNVDQRMNTKEVIGRLEGLYEEAMLDTE